MARNFSIFVYVKKALNGALDNPSHHVMETGADTGFQLGGGEII